MRSIFHFSFHYLARRRQASARWGRGSARARSPPPGFAQVRASQRPVADARARRRRRPLDRLHREILVSRNNVAQIFTRSFNDDGRTDDVRRQAKTMRRLHTLETPRRRHAERQDAAHGTLH